MRIISLCLLLLPALWLRAERLSGGDISLLPDYEKAGAVYKTSSGEVIPDLIAYSAEQGMNAMRVRLFLDPAAYHGADADPNACQTLEYILPLCRRIKDSGMQLLLDFHYSDTWADPAKQYTPAAWASMSDEQLETALYEYTLTTLLSLKENGVEPDLIQTGNEISYGMLWGPEGTADAAKKKCFMGSDENWQRFGRLLRSAGRACREACPQARIVIHTERVAEPAVLRYFYDRMESMEVDYDVIGLSYYPYFHGDLATLEKALTTLESSQPGKLVMVVETGYSYKWEVPGSIYDFSRQWPLSAVGQNKFLTELEQLRSAHDSVQGLFWWWPEYNAFSTSLSGWYNAPLFDSLTGQATPAFLTLASWSRTAGVERLPMVGDKAGDIWFDLTGRQVSAPLPRGIYVRRGEKIIVR